MSRWAKSTARWTMVLRWAPIALFAASVAQIIVVWRTAKP